MFTVRKSRLMFTVRKSRLMFTVLKYRFIFGLLVFITRASLVRGHIILAYEIYRTGLSLYISRPVNFKLDTLLSGLACHKLLFSYLLVIFWACRNN